MNPLRTFFLLAAALLPLLPGSLSGKDKEPVEVSFITLSGVQDGVRLANPNASIPIHLVPQARSGPYPYLGTSPLTLVREARNEQGQTIQHKLASIPIPANASRVLVILSPSSGNGGSPLNGFAINDGPEAFPASHFLVFNFQPSVLAVSADTAQQPAMIDPGQNALLRMGTNARGRTWIRLATQKNGNWRKLPPVVTELEPNMRVLALAYEQNGEPLRTLIFDSLPSQDNNSVQ